MRAIQKLASSTRRRSRGGLPPSGLADTTKGSKKDHSSSVRRPRINADLHARDQLGITSAPGWESPQTPVCPRRLASYDGQGATEHDEVSGIDHWNLVLVSGDLWPA
ncbi:hypothetical protein GCM10010964_28400 [Caldovatus sediminis]|uniref:Uncharacterized protein n=1 Tax=Caldovatus sediminis TaxID=2041189 RepID=A0A8J3ED39_9PROT|nr:hypothetical protein GCM10010964_28400 [Caldovatus sediminis]